MKKTLAIALSVVMILAIAIPAFADYDVTVVAPSYDGLPINDVNIYSSDGNLIRMYHTPSRNKHLNSVAVMNGTESYLKLVGPQWIVSDDDISQDTDELYLFTLRRGTTINGFAGHCIDYASEGSALATNVTDDDARYTEWAVSNDTTSKYLYHSGMGYTFIKDSNTKVRIYFLYLGAEDQGTGARPVQVMYYDYDAKVDLSAAFHEYKIYYSQTKGEAIFYVDNTFAARITFADIEGKDKTYDSLVSYIDQDGQPATFTSTSQYRRAAALYDSQNKLVGETDRSMISSWCANNDLAVANEGDELHLSRWAKVSGADLTWPTVPEYNPTTGDSFTIFTVVAVLSVAVVATTVVVIRKKEEQY